MARRIGTLCAAGEKYQTRDGEKTRWIKCGVLLETDKGFRVKLDCVPLGSDGWLNCFEDEQETTRGANPPPRQEPARHDPAPAHDDKFDDSDLPF
jgi:hypothetical protein